MHACLHASFNTGKPCFILVFPLLYSDFSQWREAPLRDDLLWLALIEGTFGQVQQVGQDWNSSDGIKRGGER